MARTKINPSLLNPLSSSLNMGTNKITNQANGTTSTDGAAWGQLKVDLIGSATASSSASISFTGVAGGNYSQLFVVLDAIVPASSGVFLLCTVSTGSGFDASAFNSGQVRIIQGGANGFNGDSNAAAWTIGPFTEDQGSPNPTYGRMDIFGSDTNSNQKYMTFAISSTSSNGADVVYTTGGGRCNTDSAHIDGVKFSISSGNIASGTFYLYGIRNS